MFGIPSARLSVFSFTRGKTAHLGPYVLGVCRLPDDSVGNTNVTFSGVNSGSEIRVYLPDTTEIAGVENCTDNHQLSWVVYPFGSANNIVRIVIIHPNYKIKEFDYTSIVGNQSLPAQQERDKWYSNPV